MLSLGFLRLGVERGMGSESRYRTSDLYYAAYLKVACVPYLGVVWDDTGGKRKAYFLFDERQIPMADLKSQYFQDRAKVRALSYAQAVRGLKRDLFDR